MEQKLNGFVGQSMDGRREVSSGFARLYRPGSYIFRPPRSGWYKFIIKGAGGGASAANRGSSGAHAEKTVFVSVGQSVAVNVGAGGGGTPSSILLPDGSSVVAGAGGIGPGTAGTASNGDFMLNGSDPGAAGLGAGGGTAGAGAGAPGTLDFPGGHGQPVNGNSMGNITPGAGGANNSSHTQANGPGGDGLVFVVLARG